MSVPAIHVPMVDFPSAGSRRHSRGLGTLRAADPEKAPLPLAGVQLRAHTSESAR